MTQLLINVLAFLWVIRTVKAIFFWIYLWQLKEYHIGRLTDHFRTHKGRQIFVSPLPILKVILLAALLANYYFFGAVFWVLLLVYLAESVQFLATIHKDTFKKPKFTAKTILLTVLSLSLVLAYLLAGQTIIISYFWLVFSLLVFDVFLPVIVSLVVLAVQPFFVMARWRILAQAKAKLAHHKNLTVIAITGSYGKTSTKEFLATMLSEKFKVLATPEHKNSEMGIAQTILHDLKEDHKIFIVEMGAYNKGGIALLCDMAPPDIGMITGVNEQHLATFGSLENLLSAEGGRELAAHLPGHGILVVNGENKYCADLYKEFKGHKRIYTSKVNTVDADLWAEQIEVGQSHVDFTLVSRQRQMSHIQANILGAHNIQNLLGAAVVAKELGMSLEEIAAAGKKIKPEQAGITLKTGMHGINIIDSSYSSNPDGVTADLEYLNIFNGKKVVVMPCLIELGGQSAVIHEEIGKKLARVCDLAIITSKDKFKELAAGFMSQGLSNRKILLLKNPKEIFNMITTFCKEGDAVLLEGGRPTELIKLLNG